MSIVINILLVFEVLICLLLILIVLMQPPKNEGLGAALGGGVTENLLGHQTTNVLRRMTRNLGIAFFAISALLGWLTIA
jgi:preprotein translocase subunit SecG